MYINNLLSLIEMLWLLYESIINFVEAGAPQIKEIIKINRVFELFKKIMLSNFV